MKRIFEGASVLAVILFIVTTSVFFIGNVKNHNNISKLKSNHEKKINKLKNRFSKKEYNKEKEYKEEVKLYSKKIIQERKNKHNIDEKLNYHKKLSSHLWNFIDPSRTKRDILPEKFEINKPSINK